MRRVSVDLWHCAIVIVYMYCIVLQTCAIAGVSTYGFQLYIQLLLHTKPDIALHRLPHVSYWFYLLDCIHLISLV